MDESKELDCLLVYIPKLDNFYKPIGNYFFAMQLPMGLLAIADLVYKSSYSIEILHLGIEIISNKDFSFEEYLKRTKPKVVGLSLHWYYQSYDVIESAKKIKLILPDSFIVLGGMTASYYAEQIMEEFNCIDAVVRGDGEKPFLKLLQEVFNKGNNFFDIPNLTWRNKNEIKKNQMTYVAENSDLDELSFTNFRLIKNYSLYIKYARFPWIWPKGLSRAMNLKFILDASLVFPLTTYRGCLVDCSYCGGGKVAQEKINNRKKVSIRSIDRVIESIKAAQSYGYNTIYINYLPFEENPLYFDELFKRIKEEKIRINCMLECSALPSQDSIRLFKSTFLDSSATQIFISPESGSEKVRRSNKGYFFDNQELTECLRFISGFQIPVVLYFCLGLPFESIDDIKISKDFQTLLKKSFRKYITIHTEPLSLIPASPMEIDPSRYGIIKTKKRFMDFFQNSGISNSSFFPTDLGYFKVDFCFSDQNCKGACDEFCFKRNLQKIKCKNFCKLVDLITGNRFVPSKAIFLLSKLLCNVSNVYWKLESLINGRSYTYKSPNYN